jgi:hypothetical protein
MNAAQAEAIVALHVPRMIRDAEALLAVVAGRDVPGGVAVLTRDGRPDAAGLSIGSGHALALANGCRPGAIAVNVEVGRLLRNTLEASLDDCFAGLYVARMVVEHVAVHELAHALTREPDAVDSVAVARAMIAAARKRPRKAGAASHTPAWAAALVILTGRAVRARPSHERPSRLANVQDDLALHGFDADAVADAVGLVPDDASVREALAPSGAVLRRLAAVVPAEAERQALIEQCRQHGAAGCVFGSFPERTVV